MWRLRQLALMLHDLRGFLLRLGRVVILITPWDSAPAAPDPAGPATATFHTLPDAPLRPLEELFRANVINLLVEEQLLPPERVQVLYFWKHSGFNGHACQSVPPEAKADLEDLA